MKAYTSLGLRLPFLGWNRTVAACAFIDKFLSLLWRFYCALLHLGIEALILFVLEYIYCIILGHAHAGGRVRRMQTGYTQRLPQTESVEASHGSATRAEQLERWGEYWELGRSERRNRAKSLFFVGFALDFDFSESSVSYSVPFSFLSFFLFFTSWHIHVCHSLLLGPRRLICRGVARRIRHLRSSGGKAVQNAEVRV